MIKPHILVVDDDARLRSLLEKYLKNNNFVASSCANAAEARYLLEKIKFDLIVLDVMMPKESGIDFALSYQKKPAPILMLTAMNEPNDRIKGLESGVDDYLAKPFEPRELVLRIENILRKIPKKKKKLYHFGSFQYDLKLKRLESGGERIALTSSEQIIIDCLCEHINKPVSRQYIADKVGSGANERTIDVQITRLRKKLGEDAKMPEILQTVRGEGYILRGS